ncbi:hypothetical protein NC651_029145 [Populus alba x Populus x berolinensis]|nr:hypothetical protein NC651_029145 [Populus alba x Populus x berolinensis]
MQYGTGWRWTLQVEEIIRNFGKEVIMDKTLVVGIRVSGPPELKVGALPNGRVMKTPVDREVTMESC